MFEPEYTERMSILLEAIGELQDSILSKDDIKQNIGKGTKGTKHTQKIKNMCGVEETFLFYQNEDEGRDSIKKTSDEERGSELSPSFTYDRDLNEGQ